jgi:hypothetical protein
MADSPRLSTQTASTAAQPEQGNTKDTSTTILENKFNPDPFLVSFDEDDPANPKVLSSCCKISMLMSSQTHLELVFCQKVVPHPCWRSPSPQCVRATFLVKYKILKFCPFALSSTFSSSAPSALVPTFMEEFGISQEVGTLTVSLFVCGYCVGPLIWGPLSEQYGRRPIFIISFFIYMVSRLLESFPAFHSIAFVF